MISDTVAGANASANLYSLLQTCIVNGIDGYRYLGELRIALHTATTVDDYPWARQPAQPLGWLCGRSWPRP